MRELDTRGVLGSTQRWSLLHGAIVIGERGERDMSEWQKSLERDVQRLRGRRSKDAALEGLSS